MPLEWTCEHNLANLICNHCINNQVQGEYTCSNPECSRYHTIVWHHKGHCVKCGHETFKWIKPTNKACPFCFPEHQEDTFFNAAGNCDSCGFYMGEKNLDWYYKKAKDNKAVALTRRQAFGEEGVYVKPGNEQPVIDINELLDEVSP